MSISLKLFSRAKGETLFVGAHVLEGDRVTIGRSKECSLTLPDPERLLSRVQAELIRADHGYRLKVASTHTPVAVNGRDYPPGSEVAVGVGDMVTMDVHDIEIAGIISDQPPAPVKEPVREPAPQPRRVIPLSAVNADTTPAPLAPAGAKRSGALGIGIGVGVVAVAIAAFVLWPKGGVADRDSAQKPVPAPAAVAAVAPAVAPPVVPAPAPVVVPVPEPAAVAPTAPAKDSWDSVAHRKQLEGAAGKARECLRSGNVVCAEKGIAEAKKHVSHENKTDETVDAKTIESLMDSLELAKKLVRADALRKDEEKRKGEDERKRAAQVAAAPAPAPVPPPAPAPARANAPAASAAAPAPVPARAAPAAVAAAVPAPAAPAPLAPKDEVWVDNYTNTDNASGQTKSFPKRDAAIPGNVIASRMGSEKDARALWGPQGAKTIRYTGCNPCGVGSKITVVIDFGHMVDTHEYVRIK